MNTPDKHNLMRVRSLTMGQKGDTFKSDGETEDAEGQWLVDFHGYERKFFRRDTLSTAMPGDDYVLIKASDIVDDEPERLDPEDTQHVLAHDLERIYREARERGSSYTQAWNRVAAETKHLVAMLHERNAKGAGK